MDQQHVFTRAVLGRLCQPAGTSPIAYQRAVTKRAEGNRMERQASKRCQWPVGPADVLLCLNKLGELTETRRAYSRPHQAARVGILPLTCRHAGKWPFGWGPQQERDALAHQQSFLAVLFPCYSMALERQDAPSMSFCPSIQRHTSCAQRS